MKRSNQEGRILFRQQARIAPDPGTSAFQALIGQDKSKVNVAIETALQLAFYEALSSKL